ncbi:CYCLIN-DEPENDENT KINASE INHIBITOR 4-RELATED [Salix purpurea]|uniref:Cyclin-dependent kinase inhibitor n=1 Tax=Salix purpurea TaxID=77065 RepID=A0A9Q0ZH76_SALPP|nr:CYCLIN-DEPENDENT KINASE INHIBITOR 4-RELATED [Salix purpurea]
MGKYMRKAKTTNDVAVLDMSYGVRTRAKTLALKKQQALKLHSSSATPPSSPAGYLQLRSRRLEKKATPSSIIASWLYKEAATETGCVDWNFKMLDLTLRLLRPHFGYFLLSTRESTPCNLTRGTEDARTPGSSTKPSSPAESSHRLQNSMRRCIPTTHEMDEFFGPAEEEQLRRFTEKFNFDPVSDKPLPGRYEWEKLDP